MTRPIQLQLTRLPTVHANEEVTYEWLIRAFTVEGHGCDVLVYELNPPYTTLYEVSADGQRQRLQIFDAFDADGPIASTIWPILVPVEVPLDVIQSL